ncbi:TROVE domain-containing protein [Rubricoccus marinus]|uniref:RNA-binding protein n=1 Tax=Rubricoccus marinus TaxID=716817 RepID=A0A259TWK2_9BACT|nr:TROVE domain-containing protein [Rubricoccus marinus]OZC02133.1 RNA-binding protein [Rubricoccus marinus]
MNTTLFRTLRGRFTPAADALNEARAPAYALSPKQALAQMAATGTLNATFYASAETQLDTILALAAQVEPEFVAQTAIVAREEGYMKDVPALLAAHLATRDVAILERVFPRVIDNGRMLRNFVQIVRSGAVGRKSLGSAPRRMVRDWLASRSDESLFRASVGNQPSLADIVKMVHPRPATETRRALYAYLIGREHDASALPDLVQAYEAFKADPLAQPVPDVPFQMIASLGFETPEAERAVWAEITRTAPWHATRMNLNAFARHGAFDVPGVAETVAARLSDPEAIRRARVFPYQLFVAWAQTGGGVAQHSGFGQFFRRISGTPPEASGGKGTVPAIVRDALQDAMEIAIGNVPEIRGNVVVCPDVSGSMQSPATGYRRGSTSAVRCVDVAALVAASVVRKNPRARVLPFEHRVVDVALNARDSVVTNAQRLAAVGGGGTDCSAPLAQLVREKADVDLVFFVSDNESWVDAGNPRSGTATMKAWNQIKARNPGAKLVCLDIQPYRTVQAQPREDILHVGGFSDRVFEVVAAFASGESGADHWVGRIARTPI